MPRAVHAWGCPSFQNSFPHQPSEELFSYHLAARLELDHGDRL